MAKTETPRPAHEPAGFFALRTPLLPFDDLLAWSEGLEAPAALAEPNRLEAALAADRDRLRARLREVIARPEVREALFVASPSLDESIAHWLEAPGSERGLKVERTLTRYFQRMAARPTPFGLFAGCSVGELGAATRVVVAERAAYRRHTRLDMDYLFALTEALARDPALRPALVYRPSSSLYRAGGRLRYAEARLEGPERKIRTYHLVAVEPTDYLDATLARSEEGAALAELARALVAADPEIAPEEAAAFVSELVDSQLLVPELAPPVTGREPIHRLIDELRDRPVAGGVDVAGCLDGVRQALDDLDGHRLGVDPERYRAVARSLEGLPATVELPRLFQVDMVKPAPGASLGAAIAGELGRAVELLHRICLDREDRMSRFRAAFVERYEGREVPLVEALDEESGIGFNTSEAPSAEASPLLVGLAFPPSPDPGTERFTARDAHLLRRLEGTLAAGAEELVLDEADFKALERRGAPPLPDAFAVLGTLGAASEEALARGEFRFALEGVAVPSGANLLARFCHADEHLYAAVERSLRAEEAHRPEAIFAEVVHLPEGRVGNILLRPVLRGHEIPYLGRSGAPRDRQIEIDDLLVSVVGGRVVLRSRRLGREVLPRLTNAHAYERGLGVYRFLCSLQYQGIATGLGWSWGGLESAAHLPRVVHGRLVLARARWLLAESQLKPLGKLRGAALFGAVAGLRDALRMPRHVAVADADNLLPVDFDNVLSVETFVQLVKDRPRAQLLEMYPPPDELCARGPEGRFVNELVVPFVRSRSGAPGEEAPGSAKTRSPAPSVRDGAPGGDAAPAGLPPRAPVTRSFLPGSEWLYVKLYCGSATTDQVLGAAAPVIDAALAAGAASSWFFLRYGDPGWHLRLRLRGEPARLTGEVLPAVHRMAAPLLADGRLWRFQLDTYEREVERYGGPLGIELAERLFQADSEAALAIIGTLVGDEGADARWRLALRGMDVLFDDFGFDLAARGAVMADLRKSYGSEFHADTSLERQLGEKYRQERPALEALLAPSPPEDHPLAPGFELLAQRSERLREVVADLRAADASGRLTLPLRELLPSYLHMMANRLLRSAARAQELVLYDFLARIYEGRAARAKRAAKPA